MIPAAVVVILNGAIVASAPPAQLLFGHVMAPLAPVITQFTERAVLDGDTITLTAHVPPQLQGKIKPYLIPGQEPGASARGSVSAAEETGAAKR